jgi:histidine triad (HIT) family protein
MDCIFCRIIKNEIAAYKAWENDNFLAFLDLNPINPGHILLIPKKHFEEIFDLDEVLYNEAFSVVKKIAKSLRNILKSKKIGIAVEGLGVPHAHIHIVPIYNGNELNPERAMAATKEDLSKIQNRLLVGFSNIN